MGKRGPRRTPTRILEARGSSLAKARARAEPTAPVGIPQCPRHLDTSSRATWRRLVPLLLTMHVLTLVDEGALARYCRLYTRWRRAEKQVEDEGQIITQVSREGEARMVKHPAAGLATELAAQLLRLEQSFGLTPSARASLAGNPEKKPEGDAPDIDYYGPTGS